MGLYDHDGLRRWLPQQWRSWLGRSALGPYRIGHVGIPAARAGTLGGVLAMVCNRSQPVVEDGPGRRSPAVTAGTALPEPDRSS
jgi:hypothetical protein